MELVIKSKSRDTYLLDVFALIVSSNKNINIGDLPNFGLHIVNEFELANGPFLLMLADQDWGW